MSLSQTKYIIEWWQNHPNLNEEFVPEDVLPYYDIYKNGTIDIYLKQLKKVRKWLFFVEGKEVITKVPERLIKVIVIEIPEIPERRQCGD